MKKEEEWHKMANTLIDLTGQRFTRLLILERAEDRIHFRKSGPRKGKMERKVMWKCLCDCGNITFAEKSCLTRNISPTRSCGCFGDDVLRNLHKNFDRHQTFSPKNQEEKWGKQHE
jgi:hypothetical protein